MGKTRQGNKITYSLQMSTLGVSFYLEKPIKCHLSVLFQCVIISIVSGNKGNVLIIIIIWEREIFYYPLMRVHWNIWNSLCWGSIFFNTPVTYFLKYFRGKFREILTMVLEKAIPHSIAIFWLTTHALHLTGFFRLQRKIWDLRGSLHRYLF